MFFYNRVTRPRPRKRRTISIQFAVIRQKTQSFRSISSNFYILSSNVPIRRLSQFY
ncbi:unnamed protein product [Schistosoma curassoni]|nr:unnamed protein product [Schistosoma curassoni]